MVKALTPGQFTAQFSNFLANVAKVPVVPAVISDGSIGYVHPRQALELPANLQPPPILALPHRPLPTLQRRFLQSAIIDRSQPTDGMPPADAPAMKVTEGRQLSTFVDQTYGLQARIDEFLADAGEDVFTRDSRGATALAMALDQEQVKDYFTQAGNFLLSGMIYSVLASNVQQSDDRYPTFLRDAAITLESAAEILFNMRYHSAAAIMYELAISDGYRILESGRTDIGEKLRKWEHRAALSWHASRLSENDPLTNRVKISRGIFHGWLSADSRVINNLLQRSAIDHEAEDEYREAGADYMRMALNRFERTKVDPVRSDWHYIPQMIERALNTWGTHGSVDGSVLTDGQALADTARIFYDRG